VAATDFTILIEGESGPQPHPFLLGFSCGVFPQLTPVGAGESGGGGVKGRGRVAQGSTDGRATVRTLVHTPACGGDSPGESRPHSYGIHQVNAFTFREARYGTAAGQRPR
jgi:hypothetical protein